MLHDGQALAKLDTNLDDAVCEGLDLGVGVSEVQVGRNYAVLKRQQQLQQPYP